MPKLKWPTKAVLKERLRVFNPHNLMMTRNDKALMLVEAQAWALANLGLRLTERDPFGCYQQEGTAAKTALALHEIEEG